MKVLFLDIDGVLVNKRSLAERNQMGRSVADPACIASLNRIVEATGCKVVLSSSWRFCGLQEMNRILEFWGCKFQLHGMTPDLTRKQDTLYVGVPRGREIEEWLRTSQVDSFVILDDDADMEPLAPHLVRTVFEHGLTNELADAAIALL